MKTAVQCSIVNLYLPNNSMYYIVGIIE